MAVDRTFSAQSATGEQMQYSAIAEMIVGLEQVHAKQTKKQKIIIGVLSCLLAIALIELIRSVAHSVSFLDGTVVDAKAIHTEHLEISKPGSDLRCTVGFTDNSRGLALSFLNRNKLVLTMGLSKSSDPFILFLDKHEHVRVDFGLISRSDEISRAGGDADRPEALIRCFGSGGKAGLAFGLSLDDKSFFRLSDSLGRDLVSVLVSPDDRGIMSFTDPNGKRSLHIGTIDAVPKLEIVDEKGKLYNFPATTK